MDRRERWNRIGALGVLAGLAWSAAGCATAPRTPAVATVPKMAASEGLAQVESSHPRLRESLARLGRERSAAAHRTVAVAYLELGITDAAFDHLRAAVALDPRDACAHDMLARLWRDWGLPERGLTAARAAVKHAPRSPVAHNTLGTLFEALGRFGDARRAYWRAFELDRGAAYALSNLTRLPAVEQDWRQARDERDRDRQPGTRRW